MKRTSILSLSLAAAAIAACKSDPEVRPTAPTASATAQASAASSATPTAAIALSAAVREGGALVRSPAGDALYLADEDHKVLRRIPIPLLGAPKASSPAPAASGYAAASSTAAPPASAAASASPAASASASASPAKASAALAGLPPGSASVSMPGAPAQTLALGDGRVLVTIRDPGLLLVMKPGPGSDLVEDARIALPADAWGLAITPDEKTALVSSAWTHQISAVDLVGKTKRWSIDVAREPRGIVIMPDGNTAYVTHLVGADLTRIDELGGTPRTRAVNLPPAPARTPSGKTLHASLGYAAALSENGQRLFVARHALGAVGPGAWFGTATVDVLATRNDSPVLPKRTGGLPRTSTEILDRFISTGMAAEINTVPVTMTPFVQPRAMVYRRSARTLLVASEGSDVISVLDALSPAPALQTFGEHDPSDGHYKGYGIATRCGAPTGLALSADERRLYVFCRGTYDIASIGLRDIDRAAQDKGDGLLDTVIHVADDPAGGDVALGRRFFYSGTDSVSSGGMGCAGCHPEGRDDGMVWHEADIERKGGLRHRNFIGEPENAPNAKDNKIGYPRQTPMLAGRVDAEGPYGWHAQNKDLGERLVEGFGLHRWGEGDKWTVKYTNKLALVERVRYLGAFLRKGLVPPPREVRDLTPVEQRGKAVFESAEVGCATCHVPSSGYTDRVAYRFSPPFSTPAGFEEEEDQRFKTPSLLFIAGTPPYFHDGHARTLEDVVDKNDDQMGHTKQLSKDDRAALVAFLRTL